ncbi:hypothetical protein LUZ60_008302 [Juncus effusus]|nr:hypothetical protein LUZ60_008302 [Juncus effusus]
MLALPLHFLLFLFISGATSLDLPSHGCYWTACQSKWFGGCGTGHVSTDQSENCNGLCDESSEPPCLPFHSHFHCCIPELPRVRNKCAQCKNKLDFGKEYVCCTDCSDPVIIDEETKLGYCKAGANLAMQPKPKETFKWVAGEWMKCSSPCDGGIRYRDVACFGSISDKSIKHYAVNDDYCSSQNMPARQEACNTQSCIDLSVSNENKKKGMSGWLIALIVILGLAAIGGVAFFGYTYYIRSTSTRNGFVYISL